MKKRLLARLTNPNATTGKLKNRLTHPKPRLPHFWISIFNILL